MAADELMAAGALFQIAEPGDSADRGRSRQAGRAIGIDLGTTHSVVAVAPNGADAKVLGGESALLPSVVSYAKSEPQVGAGALEGAMGDANRVVRSIKRFMGRGPADVDFEHPYRFTSDGAVVRIDVGDGRSVSPVEVSADILRVLARRAREELGAAEDDALGAVITVPAYFDDAQRQATRDAGRLAGLDVYRLLAEPTAAALAYGLDRGSEGIFAVYDFGGGTFDVSILRLRRGVFQVLAIGGDSALGGDDLDRALVTLIRQELGDLESLEGTHELELVARAAKEALTDAPETLISLSNGAELRVTREQFEALIHPLISKTIRACRQALSDAGLPAEELDGVVLVGGSTRVPLVRVMVERAFGRPPLAEIDPDRVVAVGAAIQADILSGGSREGVTLLDVVPLSLGLETMGGIVERIIPRNAAIPIRARQVFTNYSEKQTAMSVHVVQGERELAADCRSLARFELQGIPRLPPSMARVEISFELDADALLTVTARELMTGVRQTIEVKPSYGLSPEEVERLVNESLDHAREDFAARNLAEARVELGRVALAMRTALAQVGEVEGLLPDEERAAIEAALAAADTKMADPSASATEVDDERKALERLSEPFARRRMERALSAGMGGRTLADIEETLAHEDADLDRRRGGHAAEQFD